MIGASVPVETVSSLSLSRQLVQQLLHRAQLARGDRAQALIVRGQDGSLSLRPLDGEETPDGLQRTLAAEGLMPYALCSSSRSAGTEAPDADDLARWRGKVVLFLTVALGMKGVLQLWGWRQQDDRLQPMDVAITEKTDVT